MTEFNETLLYVLLDWITITIVTYVGIEKLKKCFQEYDLPVDQLSERIAVVCGDLEKERFGLDQSSYRDLVDSVSSIYHLGAHVNHLLGYEALRYDVMQV